MSYTPDEKWEAALEAIDHGATITEACERIGISPQTIVNKRRRDPVFAERYNELVHGQIQMMDNLVAKKCIRILESDEIPGHELVKFWYQRMGAFSTAEINVVNNGIMAVGNVNVDARQELERLETEANRLAAILAGRAVQG